MKNTVKNLFCVMLASVGLLAVATGSASAQTFPSKPIRIVVPFGTHRRAKNGRITGPGGGD
jgi:hypothetical protein